VPRWTDGRRHDPAIPIESGTPGPRDPPDGALTHLFYRPRLLHRIWAFLRGYSWIPCPICKRPFGGHEWQDGAELWITERDSVAVCPNCVEEARKANEESGYPLVEPPSPEAR